MSDEMMFGIAKMPYEMAMGDELSRRQFYENTQRLVAALEAARRNAGVLTPPEGYALVSVELLRTWGNLDELRECCRYPKHATSQPAAPSEDVNVAGMPEFDGLLDHIYEYGTASEGVIEKANAFARAVIARYAPQQPAARPPKPTECMNGCPDRQVCDHCQWPPGPDQRPAAVDEAMVARGFTLIELLIVISIVGFLVAVGVGWYSDSQRPTIELKKDDWECVKSEQRTSLQPILVGNATTLLPMTSTVCVQYNRRAD